MRQAIRYAVLLTALLLLGSPAGAHAVTLSKPGFEATVEATVSPTRLPAAKPGAPVTLDFTEQSTREQTARAYLRYLTFDFAPQIVLDTEGLPVCSVATINHYNIKEARRRCGSSLIGSGVGEEGIEVPGFPPVFRTVFLFFNAGKHKMLMYSASETFGVSSTVAVPVGGVGMRFGEGVARTTSTDLHFGKTWRYKGERHSYLNARCTGGAFRSPVKLTLSDGSGLSGAATQPCKTPGKVRPAGGAAY